MADFSTIIIEDDGKTGIARFTRADHFKSGDTGDAVEQLNEFLLAAGFLTEEELAKQGGDMTIVGTGTKNAAIFFQRSIGIDASNDDRNLISADALRGMRKFLQDEGVAANAEPFTGNAGGRELLSDFGSGVTTTTTGDPNAPTDDFVPIPEGTDFPGFMEGGTIHLVINPEGQEDFYIMEYEYPPGSGHSFYYRVGNLESLELVVGPGMGGGSIPIGQPIQEASLSTWTDAGDANEVMGIPGTFNGYIDDITREAGIAAGIDDPTLVGAALKDKDIAIVMAKAAEADWTKLQVKAALRNTDYYKDVLHPGIENFYAQSDDPEALYAMYKQNVEASLKSLGIPQDPQGGYGSQLASLLDKGVTDTAFATFAATYKQAQTNVGFAGALSKWTERFTGISISSFEDYFDVLAGNSPAEILEIAEIAGLQFMADNAGFDISDQDLRNISEATSLDQEGAAQLFSRTARDLLALGERGLRRGNLTSQQVLEAEAGIGGNVEKTRLLMSKLAREEGISDDPTATIFTDFNREGAPIKKGLQSSISEGA